MFVCNIAELILKGCCCIGSREGGSWRSVVVIKLVTNLENYTNFECSAFRKDNFTHSRVYSGDGPIMPGDGPVMPGDGPIMPGDGPLIN